MRRPDFWRSGNGLGPTLLHPLSLIWQVGSATKAAFTQPYQADIPVICVGNLGIGGAGKTPVALAVAHQLKQQGITCHFLTRGYGGRLSGPLKVDVANHTARDVGDEALLLAAIAPTWIGADRGHSAQAAARDGAQALIMDDGHQNRTLAKNLSLIVVDRSYGFGNGRVLPAGPLREPILQGLGRADAAIVLDGSGGADRQSDAVDDLRKIGLPVLDAHLEASPKKPFAPGARVVAFAGIGHPEKFFTMLESLGCDIVTRHVFGDHHMFSSDEIMRIVEEAASLGARPITTAKDAVRLPAEARPMIDVLPVEARFADPDVLTDLLAALFTKSREN